MEQRSRLIICPVMLARDQLVALADRRIAQVVGGRGHLLFVAGEAGIGKSRLVTAIEGRSVAAKMRTTRAGTYPSDLHVPAAILVDLARAMGRSGTFASLGERLTARLDDMDAGASDAGRRRRLLVLDLAELLTDAAALGPVTIVLEDLHWADDLTLEVLAALATRLSEIPLFVVATYRSDELFPRVPMRDWRARLLTQRLAEEVRLQRLSVDETGRMMALITDDGLPVPTDIASAIHRRTDGIPLHVEEFLAVLEAGDRARVDAIDTAEAPDTVQDAIVTRVEQRSADAVRLAKAGAVIGRAFDVDLLATVVDEDPDRLSAALTELADHHILLPTRTPGRLGFRHGLICDAIYDRIPEPERRRLHVRTAEAAADRADTGTDAFLSIHFERGGRRDEAYRAAVTGATAATRLSSHGEARELYARAIRMMPADLDPRARAGLFVAYGRCAAATDHNAEASDAFESARVAYLAAGRLIDAAAVVAPLVSVRHLLGDDLDERAARLRSALDELDKLDELATDRDRDLTDIDRVRGALIAELAAAFMLARRLDEAIAFAVDARRLAAISGDTHTERHAVVTLGVCSVFAGLDDGWAELEWAVETSRTAELEAEAARSYRMLGSCASVLVDYPRAERWLRDGISYAERIELWNHRHYMAAHLAHVLWATGRWSDAETVAIASLGDGRGGVTTRITALHVIGFVALGRGHWERASSALAEARDLGTAMHELQRRSPAIWGLAEIALLTGDLAAADLLVRDGLASSLEVLDAAYLFPFVVTGTRACLAAGDPLGAKRWLSAVEEPIRTRGIPGTLASLRHARGLILLADGNTAQARSELEAAVDAWRSLGRVWEGTWAMLDLARCRRRSNQRTDARRLALAVREIATDLGSQPLLSAADVFLRTGSGGRIDQERDPWAPLTAREFEVARLVASGNTNAEIAAELGVAPKTASAHLEHILAKLGVARRAEIGAWVAGVPVLHSRPHGEDREE